MSSTIIDLDLYRDCHLTVESTPIDDRTADWVITGERLAIVRKSVNALISAACEQGGCASFETPYIINNPGSGRHKWFRAAGFTVTEAIK